MSIKIERISSEMVKQLSYILATEIKDNDIKFVTVTDCKVSSDLNFAKVYVTVFDRNKIKSTIAALNNASGFIRKMLADRIDIRHIPELTFVYDESIEYGKNIENIIEKIHNNEQ